MNKKLSKPAVVPASVWDDVCELVDGGIYKLSIGKVCGDSYIMGCELDDTIIIVASEKSTRMDIAIKVLEQIVINRCNESREKKEAEKNSALEELSLMETQGPIQ